MWPWSFTACVTTTLAPANPTVREFETTVEAVDGRQPDAADGANGASDEGETRDATDDTRHDATDDTRHDATDDTQQTADNTHDTHHE